MDLEDVSCSKLQFIRGRLEKFACKVQWPGLEHTLYLRTLQSVMKLSKARVK
jgi:hypothetical protein